MTTLVVSLIIRHRDGKYMMGRKIPSGLYCPPGGKVEGTESLKAAGKRELYEETDLRTKKRDMHFIGYAECEKKLIMFFEPQPVGKWENKEPHKTGDWEWVDLDTVPEDQLVEGIKIYKRKYHARAGS